MSQIDTDLFNFRYVRTANKQMKYKPMPQLLKGSVFWQRQTWQYKLYFSANFIHMQFISCMAFIWCMVSVGNRQVIVWLSSTGNELTANTLKIIRKDWSGDHRLPSTTRYVVSPYIQPQQKVLPCNRKGMNIENHKLKRENSSRSS